MGRVLLAAGSKWIDAVEACHSPADSDERWGTAIVDAFQQIVGSGARAGLYVAHYPPDISTLDWSLSLPATMDPVLAAASAAAAAGGWSAFAPFHFGPPVLTQSEARRRLPPEAASVVRTMNRQVGNADGIGLIGHPEPGVVVVVHALYPDPIELSSGTRTLMTRLALHLEASYRVRHRPESILGELREDGKVLLRSPAAPSTPALEAGARAIRRARSSKVRRTPEALELWPALIAGQVSLVPMRGRPDRFLIVDNPPSTHGVRALSASEVGALSLASRGVSTKLTAYGLGVASSTVSSRLGTAASKLGLASRMDLIRVAAILTQDPRMDLPEARLTEAERDVLGLLQRGLSNAEIAALRSRSVRTIANQVASLLRKTSSASRRALVGRALSGADVARAT